MKVCNLPNIDAQRLRWLAGEGGGPVQHQVAKAKYLSRLGIETVTDHRACDVYHVHGPDKSAARKPVDVQTIHAFWPTDVYPEHPEHWEQQNAVQRDAIYGARAVVTLSEYTAAQCREVAPDMDVRVIPQAFDAELWAGETYGKWRSSGGPLSDEWAKDWLLWGKVGVSVLCDPTPAVEVARRCPDVIVILTAQAEDVEDVTGKLPRNVYCVGGQTFPAMRKLVLSCDILLATTLESSGQLHLEAMYHGLPVLGYRWGGVAETVEHGVHGWLAEPGDYDGLAEGAAWLASRLDDLHAPCQERAAQFTWERIAPRYAALYKELT